MEKFYSVAEAVEKFKINRKTLLGRLNRDEENGRPLYGSRRIGRQWAVTETYIWKWKDSRKTKN